MYTTKCANLAILVKFDAGSKKSCLKNMSERTMEISNH